MFVVTKSQAGFLIPLLKGRGFPSRQILVVDDIGQLIDSQSDGHIPVVLWKLEGSMYTAYFDKLREGSIILTRPFKAEQFMKKTNYWVIKFQEEGKDALFLDEEIQYIRIICDKRPKTKSTNTD